MIKRFRSHVKRSKYGAPAWRILVGLIGGLVTVIGAIALIAPGPGWLIIFAGLGILASEFAWADKALMKTKMLAIKTAQRAERVIILLTAVGFAGLGVPYILAVGIWILAISSFATFIFRVHQVWKQR